MRKIFLSVILVLTGASSSLHAQTLCSGDPKLSSLTGEYASKALLSALDKTRIWSKAVSKAGDIGEFYITPDNKVVLVFGWHETIQNGCVRSTAEGLMVKDRNGLSKWQGPFTKYSGNDFYFQRLFKSCYVDETGRRWSFSKNTITVGDQKHKAELMQDLIETPAYGNPMVLDGNDKKFWVFAPRDAQGWAVFQDTWLSDDNRPEKGPEKGSPWHVLTPCPTTQH